MQEYVQRCDIHWLTASASCAAAMCSRTSMMSTGSHVSPRCRPLLAAAMCSRTSMMSTESHVSPGFWPVKMRYSLADGQSLLRSCDVLQNIDDVHGVPSLFRLLARLLLAPLASAHPTDTAIIMLAIRAGLGVPAGMLGPISPLCPDRLALLGLGSHMIVPSRAICSGIWHSL